MEWNPYEAPTIPNQSPPKSRRLLGLNLVEWIVIVVVVIVGMAVIFPTFPIDLDAPPPR